MTDFGNEPRCTFSAISIGLGVVAGNVIYSFWFTCGRQISIHKPSAVLEVAPVKHALAVTVEPFKFSPA
jgi:hypothetical protein